MGVIKDDKYKDIYNECWKDIVENSDGSLNKNQVVKELADFSFLMDQARLVYCVITNGRLSKLNYLYEDVIDEMDNYYIQKAQAQEDIVDIIKAANLCKDKEDSLINSIKYYFGL